MPVAGPRAADRAAAHYRWAERYARAGETQRGLAHFGRALDFGGGEESGEESPQEKREIRSAAAEYVNQAFKTSGKMIKSANISFHFDSDTDNGALVKISMGSRYAIDRWVVYHRSARGGAGAVEFELGQIGKAIDKCAKDLDLDADVRVILQSLIHDAYVSLIKDRANGASEPDSKKRKEAPVSVISSSNPE